MPATGRGRLPSNHPWRICQTGERPIPRPSHRYRRNVLRAGIKGRIDGSNATAFAEAVRNAVEQTQRAVIMDLGKPAYIDSAGFDVEVVTAKSLRDRDASPMLCRLTGSAR